MSDYFIGPSYNHSTEVVRAADQKSDPELSLHAIFGKVAEKKDYRDLYSEDTPDLYSEDAPDLYSEDASDPDLEKLLYGIVSKANLLLQHAKSFNLSARPSTGPKVIGYDTVYESVKASDFSLGYALEISFASPDPVPQSASHLKVNPTAEFVFGSPSGVLSAPCSPSQGLVDRDKPKPMKHAHPWSDPCHMLMRCLIIGSPDGENNDDLPGATRMYKHLPGVGPDLNKIQSMLKADKFKEISMVPLEGFSSETFTHLSICQENIKNEMEQIKMDSKGGLLIWYSGHGKEYTGDWAMKDGYLKFEHIYDLYKKYLKPRPLYIVTDCCFSGAWVKTCASWFDHDGIKCGESTGMNIKVFASCLHTERAIDKLYIEGKGVKLHKNRLWHSKTICFAEHRELCDKDNDTQVTLGVDFTRYKYCVKRKGTCYHNLTWDEYVLKLIDEDTTKEYLH